MRRLHPVSKFGTGSPLELPLLGTGLGIAAAHQSHEFLRRRLVAAADVAALLRHRPGHPGTFRSQQILSQGRRRLDRRPGSVVCEDFNRWLTGSAGQPFIANIDVAIAHDCHPLLEVRRNSTHDCMERLQVVGVSRTYRCFGSQRLRCKQRFSTRERLKSRTRLRTLRSFRASHPRLWPRSAIERPAQ
jgi:hypothetical protein